MARIRSPNYPQLSLADSVARVTRVFENERQHPTPKEVVVKHLGYTTVNGASLGAVSALMKYGLLEKVGKDYKVTDRTISILHPEGGDAEKMEALREAAKSPALFAEVLDYYDDVLPSDDNLRAYLIRRGFAQSAVSNVIQTLRDTMELVGEGLSEYTPADQSDGDNASMRSHSTGQESGRSEPPPMPSKKDFRVMLTGEGLQVSADIADQKSVDRLIAILNANKVLLPAGGGKSEEASSDQPQSETEDGSNVE